MGLDIDSKYPWVDFVQFITYGHVKATYSVDQFPAPLRRKHGDDLARGKRHRTGRSMEFRRSGYLSATAEVKPSVVVIADENLQSETAAELTKSIIEQYSELSVIRAGLSENVLRIFSTHTLPARGDRLARNDS